MTAIASRWLRRAGLVTLALVGGCRFTQFPDPNVRVRGVPLDAVVLRRNLMEIHTNLEQRIMVGQISRKQKEALVKQYCEKALEGVDLKSVPKGQAWAYADVVRQTGNWPMAYDLLQVAVSAAHNEDRRVNDRLQLARVAAHLGKTDEAFQLCRSTFSAPAEAKAPILMGVLYEVAPELAGKTDPIAVARLVEESIAQHELVKVDPSSDSGRAFLAARSLHIRRAWDTVLKIYATQGEQGAAQAVIERSHRSNDASAQL